MTNDVSYMTGKVASLRVSVVKIRVESNDVISFELQSMRSDDRDRAVKALRLLPGSAIRYNAKQRRFYLQPDGVATAGQIVPLGEAVALAQRAIIRKAAKLQEKVMALPKQKKERRYDGGNGAAKVTTTLSADELWKKRKAV